MDALYPVLILFVRSTCIQRRHPRGQHLFLGISPHSSIQNFLIQPKVPVNIAIIPMCGKGSRQNANI